MIRTLGRLLFLFFGFGFLLVAILLLAWTGLLGGLAQHWLKGIGDDALDFYNTNKESIFQALPYAGALLSGIWAAVGFARAWHYADRNLSKRLDEHILQTANQLNVKRKEVLEFVRMDIEPGASKTWSFWSWLNDRSLRTYYENLEPLTEQLDDRLGKLEGAMRNNSIELATAHVARGLRYAQAAAATSGPAETQFRDKARAEFRSAADRDANATWALENAVEQSLKLGDDIGMAKDLERLIATKFEDRKQARYLLQHAEILLRKGAGSNDPELTRARDELDNARRLLNPSSADPAVKLDLAHTYRLLGRVQAKRNRIHSARIALNRAKDHYEGLDPAAVQRVDDDINLEPAVGHGRGS